MRFLQAGSKVKVTIMFRGREMAHQELGMKLLRRIEEDLTEVGVVEQFPKMEGRQLVMVLTPKRDGGKVALASLPPVREVKSGPT